MNKFMLLALATLILAYQRVSPTTTDDTLTRLDEQRDKVNQELEKLDLSSDELAWIHSAIENARLQEPDTASFGPTLDADDVFISLASHHATPSGCSATTEAVSPGFPASSPEIPDDSGAATEGADAGVIAGNPGSTEQEETLPDALPDAGDTAVS